MLEVLVEEVLITIWTSKAGSWSRTPATEVLGSEPAALGDFFNYYDYFFLYKLKHFQAYFKVNFHLKCVSNTAWCVWSAPKPIPVATPLLDSVSKYLLLPTTCLVIILSANNQFYFPNFTLFNRVN